MSLQADDMGRAPAYRAVAVRSTPTKELLP
jgi:hypothetical protein